LVSADGFQIPVLRQALNVGGNLADKVDQRARQNQKANQFCKADFFQNAVFIGINPKD